jgi:ubiquinone/menaquinone biosynthesis C-methylase UbiE
MNAVSNGSHNSAEIAFWNGPGGRRWVNRQEVWDRVLQPVVTAALERAAVRPGERVIDIGCGAGATTIALARLVGAAGRVVGIDVSRPMLARAAERLTPDLPIELVLADATSHAFAPGGFDLLFSRFGVMFFAEPIRAFANLRAALRPGGRLLFACFRSPQENPFVMLALRAATAHVPPLPKLGPEDPGPFSFADQERVRRILDGAGFRSIAHEPFDCELDVAAGGGLDAAVASALEIGPASRAIEDQPPEIRGAAADAIRNAFAAHQRGSAVLLPAAVWLVSASNP